MDNTYWCPYNYESIVNKSRNPFEDKKSKETSFEQITSKNSNVYDNIPSKNSNVYNNIPSKNSNVSLAFTSSLY